MIYFNLLELLTAWQNARLKRTFLLAKYLISELEGIQGIWKNNKELNRNGKNIQLWVIILWKSATVKKVTQMDYTNIY